MLLYIIWNRGGSIYLFKKFCTVDVEVDWIPQRISPPCSVWSWLSLGPWTWTPSLSLLPRPLPAERRPAAPKSHPNSSASFKDRILGGAPPPDRGGIPVPSGGSASAARFLALFPSHKGGSWMGCLPCFGSAGEGAAKKGGARKDASSDRRVTRVESGTLPGKKPDLGCVCGGKWSVISSDVAGWCAQNLDFGWIVLANDPSSLLWQSLNCLCYWIQIL